MAGDISQFSITPTGRKNIPGSMPTFTITAVVHDEAGNVIADLTGNNALVFPTVMATLSDAQAATLSRLVAMWLVRTTAGIPDPPGF